MAAQTDAPDDLISELARLMADDARSDPGSRSQQPAPAQQSVRIPGGDQPAAGAAPLRLDYGVSLPVATARSDTPSAVRIPGTEPVAITPPPEAAEPLRPDFAAGLAQRPTGPTPAAAQPRVEPSVAVPSEPVEPEAPALDQDSLADLIAAELANDMSVAPRAPETSSAKSADDFAVPPVFGLAAPRAEPAAASRPAPQPERVEPAPLHPEPVAARIEPAPPSEPGDPLSDMEQLVRPAVHMARDEPQRAPSQALRSLATPTIPVAAEPVPAVDVAAVRSHEPVSVDDAILAAAAATGARIEWVETHEGDDTAAPAPEPRMRAERRPFRMSRAVAGPLMAVSLLGIAGFGLYWVLGQGGEPTGPAPLLVADTAPVKDVPEPEPAAPEQSVVFNEISGADVSADEQIVSRDQADEEVLAEATAPAPAAAAPIPVEPAGTSGVIASGDQASIDPSQAGLVNRKVRTVTVRPDGTIVSGQDSMAGSSILPVDRPDVPEVPGADFSTPDLVAETIASASAAATEAPASAEPEVPATPEVPLVEPGASVAVVDQAGAPVTGRTVTIPMQRPDDFAQAATSALAAAAVPATAPTATAPAAAATATPSSSPGTAGAYVQLSSQRTEDAARESAQAIANRYGPLFGGASLQVQRVDLGERGIFYRVLAPATDRGTASNICTNLKAAGGDCFVL